MSKDLKNDQTPELGAKGSLLSELAERGRRFRGEKSLQDAFAEALNDLFDAYLYTLYHPSDVSPHELLALINAHREVMAMHKEVKKETLTDDRQDQQIAQGQPLHNFSWVEIVSR